MSNFCINCGEQHTLQPTTEVEQPFLERGAYVDDENKYELETEVTILKCTTCGHEMIDLS